MSFKIDDLIFYSISLVPPILQRHIATLWSLYWNNLPATFVSKFKSVVLNIIHNFGFRAYSCLDLILFIITVYVLVTTYFLFILINFYLDDYPFCILQLEKNINDMSHLRLSFLICYSTLACL